MSPWRPQSTNGILGFGISFFVTFMPIVANVTKNDISISTKGHSGLSYKSTICPTLNPYITVQLVGTAHTMYVQGTLYGWVKRSMHVHWISGAQLELFMIGGATGSVCNVPYQQDSSKLALQYYLMTHQGDCTTIAVSCLDGDGYKYRCKPTIDSTRHTKLAGVRPRWRSSRTQRLLRL